MTKIKGNLLLGFYAEIPLTYFWAVSQIDAFSLIWTDVKIEKVLSLGFLVRRWMFFGLGSNNTILNDAG